MRDQLILRKKEIETRLAILNEELREKRAFQYQGIIGPEPGLMRSYRQEIADLKIELQDVTAALVRLRADLRSDINHWFRQAAYEALDGHQYQLLVDRAYALRREYQAGPTPEPAGRGAAGPYDIGGGGQ